MFHYYPTRITGTLRGDQYTFLIIPRSVLLRMINKAGESCRKNQNKYFVFNTIFPKIVPFVRRGKI